MLCTLEYKLHLPLANKICLHTYCAGVLSSPNRFLCQYIYTHSSTYSLKDSNIDPVQPHT